MVEVIYSREARPLQRGQIRQNPRFFEEVASGATKALIDGDWPQIEAAYASAGVPTSRIDALAVEGSASDLPPHEPGAVAIPEDWADLPWNNTDGPSLRALATAIRNGPVPNKAEATDVITDELTRRDV